MRKMEKFNFLFEIKYAKERAKYATLLHSRTEQKYGRTNLRSTDPNLVEKVVE